tara:strand:- start:58 stop:585 length:528 start_codon:yes stop_codon:yes gene_type:complete
MSSLRLIKEVSISSTVEHINVENVFTSDFNVYQIVSYGFQKSSSGGANVSLRLINSSGSVIADDYTGALYNVKSNTGFSDGNRSTDTAQVYFYFGRAGTSGSTTGQQGYIFHPFDADKMTFGTYMNQYDNDNISPEGSKAIFSYNRLASITGFQARMEGATMNQGKIRVYGLRED